MDTKEEVLFKPNTIVVCTFPDKCEGEVAVVDRYTTTNGFRANVTILSTGEVRTYHQRWLRPKAVRPKTVQKK